jgi:hypothetical protein
LLISGFVITLIFGLTILSIDTNTYRPSSVSLAPHHHDLGDNLETIRDSFTVRRPIVPV